MKPGMLPNAGGSREQPILRSPKLRGKREWYRYYAGYSSAFVEDAMRQMGVQPGQTLIDPWNGSGTTTALAYQQGVIAIGVDANPALVVVARARVLSRGILESIRPLSTDIVTHARRESRLWLRSSELEPLQQWLKPEVAARLRAMERATRRLFIGDMAAGCGPTQLAGQMSSLAAFYYVALFQVARTLCRSSQSSNPTWVRVPSKGLVEATWDELAGEFERSLDHLTARLKPSVPSIDEPNLQVGSSSALRQGDASVEAVLTSPPYCTRIDYVAATRPELALLGLTGGDDLRALRQSMLGTPTMSWERQIAEEDWGPTACAFVSAVSAHKSKASASYYRRYYLQYFDDLSRSLDEIVRVAKPAAPMGFVLQDSYYKDVHLDLVKVVREMLSARGRNQIDQHDFATRTMAAVNPRIRQYRTNFGAIESFLLSKPDV